MKLKIFHKIRVKSRNTKKNVLAIRNLSNSKDSETFLLINQLCLNMKSTFIIYNHNKRYLAVKSQMFPPYIEKISTTKRNSEKLFFVSFKLWNIVIFTKYCKIHSGGLQYYIKKNFNRNYSLRDV